MKNTLRLLASLLPVLLIGACGSGGGGGSVTGRFVDDPVEGLNYLCSSGASGVTNVNGEYTCPTGDNVTFSIGKVTIGTIPAQAGITTPYSFFPGDLSSAINLARLLQSVDTIPNDGLITLSSPLVALLPANTDFASVNFLGNIETALNITLVSAADALAQVNKAIVKEGGIIPAGANIPVANAGPDQNVNTAANVTLDGSGSSDADAGNTLTYLWSFVSRPAGSSAVLSATAAVNPTFTADLDGSYVLRLVVNDGMADSVADSVTITATTGNAAPVANAGPDQNVNTSAIVTLNGAGSSDANAGDTLTYLWSFASKPAGSSAALSSTTAVNPTFTADLAGSYVVRLLVNDGKVDSVADTVTITVTTANAAPVSNAGPDQNVNTTAIVTLNGAGSSDANAGDTLTYLWSFTSRPAGSSAALSSTTAVNPTFTADVAGSYVLRLIVNDGKVDSAADTVTVTATTVVPGIVHNGTSYGTVTSPQTGKIWLDRNLGAARVCTSSNDASCYGDYYQWGRNFDGHQSSSSAKTGIQASNVTAVGHGNFITSTTAKQFDWGFDADANGSIRRTRWSVIDGSSVCPVGYRVPTKAELQAETGNFLDQTDAFGSFLKLPTGGGRDAETGDMTNIGVIGFVWTSSTDNLGTAFTYWSSSLYYYNLEAGVTADVSRGGGIAVRCIKN